MPLATNPNAIYELVLDSDKDIDKKERPKFLYRYLTGSQQIELTVLMDKIEDTGTGEYALNQIFKAASIGLIGWDNIRDDRGELIPFAIDKLKDVVGMMEAIELSRKVLEQRPTLNELKNSELQLPSDTEAAANDVRG